MVAAGALRRAVRVNGAPEGTGLTARAIEGGPKLHRPAVMFGVSVVLSNVVSNVDRSDVALAAAHAPLAGPDPRLASTLAGNIIMSARSRTSSVDLSAANGTPPPPPPPPPPRNDRTGHARGRIGVPVPVEDGLMMQWLS